MNDSSSSRCPACGSVRTDEVSDGLCPACLMRAAMQPTAGAPAGSTPQLSEVAAAFPQWEVQELIGQGGMGAVFKVRQPGLNRPAALKVIPASLAERDPAFAGRFEREGELLARLHHPNIVTVHDSGRSGDFYYLLMEYVDGVNLRQAMRAGRFTPQQALAVVPKICEALQYAHDEGVLHRDIKPENILLDSKGRVKLADFGIAKLMGAATPDEAGPDGSLRPAESGGLTQAGAALGTPRYMAPEQAEHPRDVDHRADIYSLGVVFYELLTGQLPEPAAFAPPSAYAAVDSRVDAIVRQALERERELRQHSAGEMRTQVETAAGGFSQEEIAAAVTQLPRSFEYVSRRRLCGLPLLHVVQGRDPVTGKVRTARGIFAFGESAVGWFAFGGRARGIFAFGGVAMGVVACGGVAVGLVSLGGVALALGLAIGGLAAGTFAAGGMALGLCAHGGMAVGWMASGGMGYAYLGHGGQMVVRHILSFDDAISLPLGLLKWVSSLVSDSALFLLPPMLAAGLVPAWARRQPGVSRFRQPLTASPPPVSRPWLKWLAGILVGIWLLLPVPGFLLFLYGMSQESGGWNPAPNEAFFVFACCVGTLLLPGLAVLCLFYSGISRRAAWWPLWLLLPVLVAGGVLGQRIVKQRAPAVSTVGPAGTGLRPNSEKDSGNLSQKPDSLTKAWARQRQARYESTKSRYDQGEATSLEVLDARHEMERWAAIAEGAGPAIMDPIDLDWAQKRLELVKSRHDAGTGTLLQLMDAQHKVDVAKAAVSADPEAAAAATLKWANARLEIITAQHAAGQITPSEMEQARLEVLNARENSENLSKFYQ